MRNYFRNLRRVHQFILCLNYMMFLLVSPSFETVYCYICGRRRVVVARYRMIRYRTFEFRTSLGTSVFAPCLVLWTTDNRYKQNRSTEVFFETQKSGNKTSSGEIGLDIRTHARPKVGQDQVSGGISVLCWHAAPVTNVLWKPHTIR